MESSIAPFLTAGVGLLAVCATACGLYITHLLTMQRSDREYRLKKLEEIHTGLQSHAATLILMFANYAEYAKLRYNNDQVHEANMVTNEQSEGKALAIESAVRIFFPELITAHDNFAAKRIELGDVISKLQKMGDSPDRRTYLNPLTQAAKAVDNSSKEFEQAMYRVADTLRTDNFVMWLLRFRP